LGRRLAEIEVVMLSSRRVRPLGAADKRGVIGTPRPTLAQAGIDKNLAKEGGAALPSSRRCFLCYAREQRYRANEHP